MKKYLNVVFALMLYLALVAGTFMTAIPASAQDTGSISGQVLDANTGLAVSGAHVEVLLYESLSIKHQFCGRADTDAEGHYTISGLPTGQYAVRVQAAGYVIQYYQVTHHQNEAVPLSVTASDDISNINFNLETGGSISGCVTDGATSQPIANLYIYATDYETNEWMAGTNTDDYGNYSLVVPSGSYRVRACASCAGLHYADEFYDDILNWDEALPVTIAAPLGIQNIDFSLELGGTISGCVIDAATELPVGDAKIDAFEYSSLAPGRSLVSYGWATTDADGYYITTGLTAGEYGVRAVAAGYKTEWYQDTYFIHEATPVAVTVSDDTPNINLSLDEGEDIPSIGPAPAFGWRFDSGLAIGLVLISPALYFAGRRFRKKGKSYDLTKIVYPIILFLTWWYTGVNVHHLLTEPSWYQGLVYTCFWALIPIAFSYAAIRKVKLEFKWSALSVIGMIIAAYFLIAAISMFLDPAIPPYNFFFTGIWDHTFFPMAFGLLVLCDLNKMPKIFWFILAPLAVIVIQPSLNVVSKLLFDTYMTAPEPGGLSLFFYFGVESKAQLLELPQDVFMRSLIIYLREELGFLILIPALVFYYLFKSLLKSLLALIKRRTKESPLQP